MQQRHSIMRVLICLIFCSFTVAPQDAQVIAEKIWKNECGGTVEGLTHWNQGENFGSFGIGHFIWYPMGKKERFEETFPDLLRFLQNSGIVLPKWLKEARGCPWHSREEFYRNIESTAMRALRQLLLDTTGLQARFIANQLEKTIAQLTGSLPPKERQAVLNM